MWYPFTYCGVPRTVSLKGHGSEVDFLGFLQKLFLIDPLHYFSSRSDFGFEFAEIFVIKKRLPDSLSRGVGDSRVGESMTHRLGESESRLLNVSKENLWSRRVGDSSTRRVGESLDFPTRRAGELLWSRYSNFFKFIIKLQHFKRLNQHFKGPIYPIISLGCNVLTPLIDSKV